MPTPSIQKALESFEEKFVDTEGCQAGHQTQPDCDYCRKWGGAQGEPKFNKRPLASAGTIKSFLTTTLEEIAREAYKEGCEVTLRQTDPDHKACFQELEKAKLIWGDIGYRNGISAAREKIIEADKQIGDCYPFLTTENDDDKEQMDKYNKLVYFFFHKNMENTIAAIDALINKKI